MKKILISLLLCAAFATASRLQAKVLLENNSKSPVWVTVYWGAKPSRNIHLFDGQLIDVENDATILLRNENDPVVKKFPVGWESDIKAGKSYRYQ